MGVLNQTLQQWMEQGQGSAARVIDRLPTVAQEGLVKALGYPHQFEQLDPFIKCLMAAQYKQGKSGFIFEDYHRSRKLFDHQIQMLTAKPSTVKQVEDLRLPLQSGTANRHDECLPPVSWHWLIRGQLLPLAQLLRESCTRVLRWLVSTRPI